MQRIYNHTLDVMHQTGLYNPYNNKYIYTFYQCIFIYVCCVHISSWCGHRTIDLSTTSSPHSPHARCFVTDVCSKQQNNVRRRRRRSIPIHIHKHTHTQIHIQGCTLSIRISPLFTRMSAINTFKDSSGVSRTQQLPPPHTFIA